MKRVPAARSRARYGLDDDERRWRRARASRRRREVDSVLAPHAVINFPHPLLQQGLVDPRHAGLERDRHRARAHAEPPAERARGAVHPRRRRRRHEDRPRRLEPPSGRRDDTRAKAGRIVDPQQDRRPVGRLEVGRRRSTPRSSARCATSAAMLGMPPSQVFARVGAEGAGRQGERRRRAARAKPPAGARGRACPRSSSPRSATSSAPRRRATCARSPPACARILDARLGGISRAARTSSRRCAARTRTSSST